MEYQGVAPADLAEVRALNRASLRLLQGGRGRNYRAHFAESVRARLDALTDWQVERLSEVPVLLGISIADSSQWDEFFSEDSQSNLFHASPAAAPAADIAVATLAFLWQLARTNPNSARLISAASVSWCERLADCRLAWVVERVQAHPDILRPCHASHTLLWQRLLTDGASANDAVRRAAQMCAVQTVLTLPEKIPENRFRAAACRRQVPTLQVAETD